MFAKISFMLNCQAVELDCHPLRRLLDVLREDLGLMGTKEGCGEGECGACAVLVGDQLVNACLTPVARVAGQHVTTIEGLAHTPSFQVLERCFAEAGAVQCGYCTPGMIMAAEALLRQNPQPGAKDVRAAIAGNLCRCTGYNMIVEAILAAALQLQAKPAETSEV